MTNKKTNVVLQGGKGKGKGKGKLMEEIKEQVYREPANFEDSKVKFPCAIKKNTYVLAVMRDNKTWCLAKIMEIRNKINDQDVNWG